MATDDKYDRQIRLWGAHGQRALSESKVCVLGSSPCATETLKNLVLPGIGQFTVVDSAITDAADLGNNWFLEETDAGGLRAEAVCRQLQEMNPDVQGNHIAKTPCQVIDEGIEFFRPFALVIACQLTEPRAQQLGEICKQLRVPLLLITSLGFIGKIRVYVSEHCVCETKPDNDLGDLRLNDPFPELRRYADSVDVDAPDDADHAHIPFVIILIRALDKFRETHEGKAMPKTREEKDEFKQILSGMQRNQQEGNFAEALDNAYKAWSPYSVPDAVEQVLSLQTENKKSDYWVVARAVSQFVRDCGKLPLAGTVPDMTASTESYVKLQEIYGKRAEGDCAAITAHIASIQQELGLTTPIQPEFVKRFCQNARNCEVFTFRSLEQEHRPCSLEDGGVDLCDQCSDEDSLIQWYLALRAADAFRQTMNHWPGEVCSDTDEAALASDLAATTQAANKLLESYKAAADDALEGVTVDTSMLEEVVRYGGAELHTTSSVIGGIAAQEAVKLVTKQYSPLNNTLIYNGLHGKMQVVEL
jgi:amyloid beta precursor protein binding protein 1